ncbi:MAG TPA: hypothetical protein VKD08_08790 [Ignavibacteriaceae bacterium]|jgi:hypothetical protein|nr:hypothetical protein [Ignavibacteriaceae bacterium]
MQQFTYPYFYKVLYRYGNIPVTVILSIYLVPSVVYLDKNLLYLIPVVLLLLMIYLLNKHYLNLYKIIPYKIEADDEKLICTDFLFSRKEFTIYFNDIESLTGGIFDGRFSGVMKVCDRKNQVCIGFFNRLRNADKLQTILLSKVPRKVYDDVVERVGLKTKKEDKKRTREDNKKK